MVGEWYKVQPEIPAEHGPGVHGHVPFRACGSFVTSGWKSRVVTFWELLEAPGSAYHKFAAFSEKCPLGAVLSSPDLPGWWKKEDIFSRGSSMGMAWRLAEEGLGAEPRETGQC